MRANIRTDVQDRHNRDERFLWTDSGDTVRRGIVLLPSQETYPQQHDDAQLFVSSIHVSSHRVSNGTSDSCRNSVTMRKNHVKKIHI
jgi:hypothetical protein